MAVMAVGLEQASQDIGNQPGKFTLERPTRY